MRRHTAAADRHEMRSRRNAFAMGVVAVLLSLAATAPASGQTWTAVPPPNVPFDGSVPPGYDLVAHDTQRDQLVLVCTLEDVWTLPLTAGGWQHMATTASALGAYRVNAVVYDPPRDRVLAILSIGSSTHRDVWALPLTGAATWVPTGLAIAGFGTGTFRNPMYDALRDRIVIWSNQGLARIDLSSGNSAGSDGIRPTNEGGALAYDSRRDRFLLFGGQTGITYYSSIFASPASDSAQASWRTLTPATAAKPQARTFASAVYDSARDRVVVFGGGNTDASPWFSDVWEFRCADSTWIPLSAGAGPSARLKHQAILDLPRDRMIAFGGISQSRPTNELWALSLASPAWSQVVPFPTARTGHTAAYDPQAGTMLVFGGYDFTAYHNDVWAYRPGATAWALLASAGAPPPARSAHVAVFDTRRERMIVIGGSDSSGCRDDTWALDFSSGSPAWSDLAPTGPRPSPRDQAVAAYDSAADRVILFGGRVCDGSPFGDFVGDTWQLSLSGTPAWSPLTTATSPPGRRGAAMIFDPLRQRMIVFGGQTQVNGNLTLLADTWALSLGGTPDWSQLSTASHPSARLGQAAVYDSRDDRVLMLGGTNGGTLGDLWELSLAGSPAWLQLSATTIGGREHPAAVYDPLGDRLYSIGGDNGGTGLNAGLWQASFSGPLGVPLPAGMTSRLALRAAPNPAASQVRFELRLPGADRVRLEIYDLSGRRIARLLDGRVAAGTRSVSWSGTTDSGARVPPGVYLARLESPVAAVTARVALIR